MSLRDDEDTWAVPGAWWRQVEPFRGRSPDRPIKADRAASRTMDELLAAAEARFGPMLDHQGLSNVGNAFTPFFSQTHGTDPSSTFFRLVG